jgi:hypothetical protein
VGKLAQDLRLGLLGAAAALFAGSVTLLIARIDTYYAYLTWMRETDARFDRGVEGLWWVPAFFWHMLLSVVASLMVHRYLTNRLRSTFLLWQVVGGVSLLGWGVTAFLLVGLDWVMTGDLISLQRLTNSADLGLVAKYVSTVFACNVVYGSVMHASSRQYIEQLDSNIAIDCRGQEALPP